MLLFNRGSRLFLSGENRGFPPVWNYLQYEYKRCSTQYERGEGGRGGCDRDSGKEQKGVTISTSIIKSRFSTLSPAYFWAPVLPFLLLFEGVSLFKSGFRRCFDGGSFSSSKWVRRLDFSVHLPEALIFRVFYVWRNLPESAWQGNLWLGYFITYYYLCFCWSVSVFLLLLLFCLNYCIFGCLRF